MGLAKGRPRGGPSFVWASLGVLAAAWMAVGCSTLVGPAPANVAEWHAVTLPGKRVTVYRSEQHEGRPAWAARADRSASLWRRHVVHERQALGEVAFSWWAQSLPAQGDVSDAERSDAAARVMFAFGGDKQRLSARNQMLFELAHALTGEAPPFATLAYVWDASAPVGSVILDPRSDRIRKIVVESGIDGLRQWRHYRRNLARDYQLAFGEAPGALQAVAMMTDGDNTQSQLSTWYGDIEFH